MYYLTICAVLLYNFIFRRFLIIIVLGHALSKGGGAVDIVVASNNNIISRDNEVWRRRTWQGRERVGGGDD